MSLLPLLCFWLLDDHLQVSLFSDRWLQVFRHPLDVPPKKMADALRTTEELKTRFRVYLADPSHADVAQNSRIRCVPPESQYVGFMGLGQDLGCSPSPMCGTATRTFTEPTK
jgi:hypothetical protein